MGKHRSLQLSKDERGQLEQMIRSGAAPARRQTKARILLLCDSGRGPSRSDAEIRAAVLCSVSTIIRTRQRFLDEGLTAALQERPRPGRKPKLDGEGEARLVLLACSQPPEGQVRWTLQLLADEIVATGVVASYSAVAVHKRLKKMQLSRGK